MVVYNISRGHSLRIAIGITILVLLLAGGAGAVTNINSCQNITAAGEYILTKDVSNSNAMICINITSSNVNFDGKGHTIDGIDAADSYGVNVHNISFFNGLTNVTVKNLMVTDWNYGIYYRNTQNGRITNNNARWNSNGIYIVGSINNTLIGNMANSNNGYGIRLISGINYDSSNNTLNGNMANSNNGDGIFLGSWDMHSKSQNNTLIGNMANSNNGDGIYLFGSSYNTLNGNTANSNNGNGIFLYASRYHHCKNDTLISNTANSNKGSGIYIENNNPGGSSSYNILTGNTVSNNSYGISWRSHYSSSNNRIYNNFFNNTVNFYFKNYIYNDTSDHNYWNISKISGTNIVGGPYIGGNFWAYPNGTGFSQTCPDSNNDGLCDLEYLLDIKNIDYLPLTYKPATTTGIRVTSPNGGEKWTRGTTRIIKWTSTENPKSYVKIELIKPGMPNKLIVSSTLNDGSHTWVIPATQAPGTNYKVKITSTTNAAYNYISDNYFTIPIPSFTVVSPNGGEKWTRGTTRIIKWTSTENPKSYVKIELIKPGVPNKLIVSSTLNDGSHTWLVPATQTSGTNYKVKITSTTNAAYNDTSNKDFTILVPTVFP